MPRTRRRLFGLLLLSVLLHAFSAYVLQLAPVFFRIPEEPLREKIEFEITERPKPITADDKAPSRKAARGRPVEKSATPYRGTIDPLFLPSKYDNSGGARIGPGEALNVHGADGAYGQMDAMGLEESTSLMPFFQALWQKVDDRMDFPIEVARMRVSGRVVIHARIDHKGQMIGDVQQVTADHKVLRTLALVMFYQSLKTPLPENRWRADGKSMSVVFTFDYRIVPYHGFDGEDHGDVFKNGLLFRRTRYVDPILNENIDYILTTYVPPIIPIPGGFFVDFIRAYQMIDNYMNERPDLLEQKNRKYRLLGEQLELTLKNEKPSPKGEPSE